MNSGVLPSLNEGLRFESNFEVRGVFDKFCGKLCIGSQFVVLEIFVDDFSYFLPYLNVKQSQVTS